MITKCKFISVWDDDTEIMTDAELDTETGKILNIETVDPGEVDILTDEYILANPVYNSESQEWTGTYFKVCEDCHEHIIGFQGMWDDECDSYSSHYGCPECTGNKIQKSWINDEIKRG